jgi:phosphopantetheinyl transferase
VTDLLSTGEQVPGDEAGFLATWVRKEAVLKATGEGLSRPMSTVDVTTDAVDSLRLLDLDITHLRGAGAPRATAAALAVGAQRVRLRWERARI